MTTGLLTTTAGQAAIAADLAGGADLVLSHVAFGDSNGIPYAPNEAQTTLVNEKYRSTIASVAVVAGAIVVDAVIPADTPDASARPSHGFSIAEAGLYSAGGTLIGVARMGNGYKPPPSSGQAAIATFRFKLPVANPSAITVVIDPQAQLNIGRNVRPYWVAVNDILNAPPASPATGATYVVGSAPTGAWAGFPNYLAQWVGVWALAIAPEGHLVCDKSKTEDSPLRFMKRTSTAWASAAAATTAFGFARLATLAETTSRTPGLSVSPDNLGATLDGLLGKLLIHAEVKTTDGRLTVTAGSGNVVVTGATLSWRGWKDFDLTGLSAGNRTVATTASKTCHLRWDAPGTGLATPAATYPLGRLSLRDLADAAYNPSALAEDDVAFDSTFDSVLVARVVTNGANVSTITTLANKTRLSGTGGASGAGSALSPNYLSTFTGGIALNWGRTPSLWAMTGYMSQAGGGVLEYANTLSKNSGSRYALNGTVASNWNESYTGGGGTPPTTIVGNLQFDAIAA